MIKSPSSRGGRQRYRLLGGLTHVHGALCNVGLCGQSSLSVLIPNSVLGEPGHLDNAAERTLSEEICTRRSYAARGCDISARDMHHRLENYRVSCMKDDCNCDCQHVSHHLTTLIREDGSLIVAKRSHVEPPHLVRAEQSTIHQGIYAADDICHICRINIDLSRGGHRRR